MTKRLPESLLRIPIAHRALHDVRNGTVETSLSAIRAAIEAGYGIEIDVQQSADGQAMVFHDYELDRLTNESGLVRERSAEELGRIALKQGNEGIPRLQEVLEIVAGRVALLVEIKDQARDHGLGRGIGTLEQAVADAIEGYEGDVAVMSFNPHSLMAMQRLAPSVPRGLTTEDFVAAGSWHIPKERLAILNEIDDYERAGACIISHNHRHLSMPRVAELKAAGAAVLCWTVRSPEEEADARRIADNITFEGYRA